MVHPAIAEFLTTLSCGLFTGAAVYITLVEHPARMACGTLIAATEFRPSYRRAAVMQASLAATGFLSSIVAWAGGADLWWLVGGLVLALVIPFTLLVMRPTNRRLLDLSPDRSSEVTRQLLTRWGRLHAVRSGLSLVALVIFLYRLIARTG
jgi:uncharacterized membrane protein